MSNPRKFYLVDSENVNDLWVNLLDQLHGSDQIIVFYTSNSPHMCLDKVIRLMQTKRSYVNWIRCFEGNNALDFQLVTQLGTMIAKAPTAHYFIVSNDTGFDAAVKYWKRAGVNIKRIRGIECKMKDTESPFASTERMDGRDVHKSDSKNEKRRREDRNEKTEVTEKVPDSKPNRTDRLAVADWFELTEKSEKTDGVNQPEKSVQKDEPKPIEAAEKSEPERTADGIDRTNPQNLAEPEVTLAQSGNLQLATSEQFKPLSAQVDSISAQEDVSSNAEPPVSDVDSADASPAAALLNFLDDANQAECVYRLSQSVSMSNLSTLRATLSHIFGRETGNVIYRKLRQHPDATKALKANYLEDRGERRRQYFLLLLDLAQADTEHVDALLAICSQATKEDLPKLNTTIQKTFEKANWATYYKIVKRNIQILQSL